MRHFQGAFFVCTSWLHIWWKVRLLYVAKQCDASHSPVSWTDVAFEIDGSDVI